ncbi:MAG TPA: NAD-dependent epimerase/dehydratase family protein [Candidatus Binatia bacterium]|nr:NAD-dependent epimerase/dehydratase family protein [Candidatus Binatia bacterium]
MRSLIIGGTRNLGPSIVHALLNREYHVTVFNRGQTRDDLPEEVERLRGDRTNQEELKRVLSKQTQGEQTQTGREFDLVIDTTLYTGAEAETVVELFKGRVGRYIFLSTGQVYLVRVGAERPYKEDDYAGPVMAEPPKSNVSEYENWRYGFDKRAAEDVFASAWAEHRFPFTSLRLPMVNSERDHYGRIYGYFLRIQDEGPIFIPDDEGAPVRHVYGEDVVQAITRLAESDKGKGHACNIGQDETLSLVQFLELLAETMHCPLKIVRVPREELNREGLLPHCSPFSGKWMSSLENTRSKAELGMQYTPVATYVKKLVSYFLAVRPHNVEGYAQRQREVEFAKSR